MDTRVLNLAAALALSISNGHVTLRAETAQALNVQSRSRG